jgi:cell division septal protein FtsQ
MMVYHGRAGLWDDWLKFQKEAKQRREAEEKAEFRKKAARKAKIWLGLMWTLIVSLLGVLMTIGLWVVSQLKGK